MQVATSPGSMTGSSSGLPLVLGRASPVVTAANVDQDLAPLP